MTTTSPFGTAHCSCYDLYIYIKECTLCGDKRISCSGEHSSCSALSDSEADEREAVAVAFVVLAEFGVGRTDVYARKVRQFSQEPRNRLANICNRLREGQPVQYALGKALFMEREYEVTRDVLIPRPETEELVRLLVDWADGRENLRILDAGTGSGCIAVSLQLALPTARVEAWDISPRALEVAKGNAERLGAVVHFDVRDMLAPGTATEPFDLIVSNPPYVCEREKAEMAHRVLDYEPASALFVPDNDALRFYRALAQMASGGWLRPGGLLAVEINRAYGAQTVDVFTKAGLGNAVCRTDAFGNDRMVLATLPANL